MTHAPRAFVSNTDLPFDFFGRDTVSGAGHKIHREEPFGQIRARFVEDRSGAWINMVPAMLADVGAALAQRVKLCVNAAPRASDLGSTVVHFHELGETRGVIRVHRLELLEGALGHGIVS